MLKLDRKLIIIPIIIGALISGVFLLVIISNLLSVEEPVEEIIPTKITRGPFLSMVTQNSIYVSWWTNEAGNSTVRYGTDQLMDNSVFNGTDVIKHEIKLEDLIFNKSYYYQVQTANFTSKIYTFKTAPGFSAPVKLAMYGDNRGQMMTTEQPDVFTDIVKNMNDSQPDLIFALGDLIPNDETYLETDLQFLQSQWDAFFNVIENYTHEIPWIYAIGNHDAPKNTNESSFTDVVVQPKSPDKLERYFSFDYGPIHFIVLDTELQKVEIEGDQWEWLVEDISSPRQSIHTFILMHKPLTSPDVPPYWGPSVGTQRGLLFYEESGAKFQQLCENYSVTAIICSHDHMYHYDQIGSHNLTQVVTAGGGAPLYVGDERLGGFYHHTELEINWKDIRVKVIKDNETIMDEFSLDTPYDLDFPNKPNITEITFSSLDCDVGSSIDIEATIEGTSLDVKLFYSFDSLNWHNQSMTPLGQNYSGSIECLEATEIGQFYIDVKDNTNNRTISDLYSFNVNELSLTKGSENTPNQYLSTPNSVDSREFFTNAHYETKTFTDSLILIEPLKIEVK